MNDFENIISKDLKDTNNTALVEAYAKYQELVTKRGILGGDTKEILDARKALISLSPSMQERIRKYGTVVSEDPATATPTAPGAETASKPAVVKGADGKFSIPGVPKEVSDEIVKDYATIAHDDSVKNPSDTKLKEAVERYTKALKGGNEQELMNAVNDLVTLSPTIQKKIKDSTPKANDTEDEFAANKVN